MVTYIYIDESGDLGVRGSRWLILCALLVDDFRPLDRIIKRMRRHKFSKALKGVTEIKAHSSSAELITHMLIKLADVRGARAVFLAFDKKNLFSEYLRTHKHKLYDHVAGKLAQQLLLDDFTVEIHIDKSKGKQFLQQDFNRCFLKNLHPSSKLQKVALHHSHSHSWSGLQFADVLAWSCFQKLECNRPRYFDLIRINKELILYGKK